MAIENQFVEIGGLLWREPVPAEVVEDEQIGGPEGTVQRVVDPSLGHGLEEVIGVDETDCARFVLPCAQ